ncbi:MAG: zinc ribbon domain-containing protein [Lachnospiraceae bacterium]|nr:zinc ribbon domain-containing protein [Lachnospiraceae bacterium]
MKKKIAISAVLAVLLTAYAVVARWRTLGLGIYTLNTTVGKLLIHTWRPALVLAVVAWIVMALFISAQRKKSLAEPRESRAEKKARIKAEKEAAKAEAKAARMAEKKSTGNKSEPISEVRPVSQGATVVLNKKPVAVPDEPGNAQEPLGKVLEEPANAQKAVDGMEEVAVHAEIETEETEKVQEAPAALKVTATRSGFCGNCGAPMKETQRFCTKCGCEAGKEDTL